MKNNDNKANESMTRTPTHGTKCRKSSTRNSISGAQIFGSVSSIGGAASARATSGGCAMVTVLTVNSTQGTKSLLTIRCRTAKEHAAITYRTKSLRRKKSRQTVICWSVSSSAFMKSIRKPTASSRSGWIIRKASRTEKSQSFSVESRERSPTR
jgi:hypothetical protein